MRMDEKAQALVEYVLIIAIVSMIIIGLVKTFGGYLKDSMTKTSCSIGDLEYVKGDKPGQGRCEEPEEETEDEDNQNSLFDVKQTK